MKRLTLFSIALAALLALAPRPPTPPPYTVFLPVIFNLGGAVTTAGPNYPSIVSVELMSGHTWQNPLNVYADNGSITAADTTLEGQTTDNLWVTGYGFTIPSDATINGIKVEIKHAQSPGSDYRVHAADNLVRLRKSSGQVGSNYASASPWPVATLTYAIYGGPTDLWGTTWVPSDINNSGFGLTLQAIQTQDTSGAFGDSLAQVDTIRITVYYTVPPTATPRSQVFMVGQ